MPNVLEVQIIGDVSSLEKSLKTAEKLQADYTTSIEKTSKELSENIAVTNGYKKAIEDLNKSYKDGKVSASDYSKQLSNLKRDEKESTVATADLRKELANLKREQKDLGGATGVLSKRTADGSNALTQFSRIAQDAPFGIQGIGNNITATVEAFGHLQKSTGSTGAALKAVASSMLGSGGILLAVSLVTTGLTYMAQNGITVGDVFDKLTGTFDENAKALSEVGAEAAKSAQYEISSINAYVDAAKNRNLSDSDRLIAVKKLQSEYPAYFGNLTKEQILNGNVAVAVQQVTAALIAKAKAAGFSEKIADLAKEEFLLRQKEKKGIEDLNNAYKSYSDQKGKASAIGGVSGGGGVGGQIALNAQKSSLKDIQDEIRGNISQQRLYTEEINKATAAQIGLEKETEKASKVVKVKKDPKIDVTPRVTAIPIFDIGKSTDDENDAILKMLRDSLSEDINKLKLEGVDVNIPLRFVGENEFLTYIENLRKAREETKIFSDAVGSSVGVLTGQLTSSFETGNAVLDAFVGSLIGSLAQIAQAQITSLIAEQTIATAKVGLNQAVSTSNAVTAATSTAAASGPAAAFLLPALVGAAIGFVAASFAGIKFAHGGVVPGGSYTGDKIPAMLNSGETVMNQQQQANTLMAIANGNSNSLQGNRSADSFDISTVLRGSDILLSIERQKKKR